MSKKTFDKIAEGLSEAIAISRGEAMPAKLYVPPEIDVRAVRTGLGFSQDEFASAFGFSVHQVRQWEQGRVRPVGAIRAYLMIIGRHPKRVLALLRGAASEARKKVA